MLLIGQIDRNRNRQETVREEEMGETCNKGQAGDVVCVLTTRFPGPSHRDECWRKLFKHRKMLNWLK